MMKHSAVLFVLVALFGAACSSDAVVEQATSSVAAASESGSADEQTLPEATPASEPVAAAEDTAASEPVDVVASDENPEPVVAVDRSSAASLLGADDWCTAAAQIENMLDPDDLSDPVALEESYTEAVVLIAEIARIAPAPIAPDVAAMADAVVAFSSLLADAEWNFLAVDLVAMEEVAIAMDVPGYNIEKYNFEVCGLGEDPGPTPDFTTFDDSE